MSKVERNEVTKFLINRISKLSGTDVREISIHKAFNLLGLSSLDGIQLVDDLNEKYRTSYSPTILFDYPNIHKLVEFLLDPKKYSADDVVSLRSTNINEPIAIIGMECQFPGAENINEFWKLLSHGKDAIKEVPIDRWSEESIDFKAYGGFIDKPNSFDNRIFDIYENESKYLDPQQRKVLETSWRAIENAGYSPQEVMGSNTGVYIGISTNDYSLAKVSRKNTVDLFDGIGGAHSIAANRISYFFNFHGPSWAVDTACSSSLVSVSQAVGHLRSGECDMALAGGVNILYTSHLTQSFMKAGMLSPDGKCKTFSDDANGYVRGEGCGIIVLKRLSDALRDKDHIYGVVRGFSFNQDGRSNGLTAPNGKAQEAVIKKALHFSRLEPKEIDYVEAHGTGTPLGDPIEYQALENSYGTREDKLFVGSVKTNIGHLEAAAGIAGIIKVLLAMEHNKIPKSLNFSSMNRNINTSNTNLEVVTKETAWIGLKRAGVSSFGFGGTNAHLILESYEGNKTLKAFNIFDRPSELILMVAASGTETLKQTIEQLILSFKSLEENKLEDFCYQYNKRTSILPMREVIIGSSKNDFLDKLEALKAKNNSKRPINEEPICFAFTGQGSQYSFMAQELSQNFSIFSDHYEKVRKIFEIRHNVNFSEIEKEIYQTGNGQISLFCFEYALFHLLKDLGLESDFFIGHSLGEVVAYICADGITLEEGIDLIYFRSQAMQKSPKGGMAVIYTSLDKVKSLLKNENILLDIGTINSPELTAVSGKTEEVKRFIERYESDFKIKELKVEQGFHSYLMDEVLEEFSRNISHIEFKNPLKTVVSSVSGELLLDVDKEYWVSQIRKPTDFVKVCQTLSKNGFKNIIEIGPSPTLCQLAQMNLGDLKGVYATQSRGESFHSFLSFLKKIFLDGIFVQTKTAFYKKHLQHLVLPSTCLSKKEFSFDKESSSIENKANIILTVEEVISAVSSIVSKQLEIEETQIDIKMPIMNFGADSLLLLNVLDTIKDEFGTSIAITDVFQDLNTIELIGEYIVKSIDDVNSFEEKNNKDLVQDKIEKTVDADLHEKSKGVLGSFSGGANKLNFSEGIAPDVLQKLIVNFTEKTKTSKEWSEKYRSVLSDNRVSAGFRPNLKEMVYPIVWKEARGAYFWDLDNNKYIDFTMGFGVNLFGHSPEFINSEIEKQLKQGMALGPQSHMAALVAEKFCKLTNNERIAFLNSGTEAVMTAIRLARAKTKRELMVIFEGSYHGHFDGVLGRTNSRHNTVPVAPGIPTSLIDGLVVLDYGTDEAIEKIKELGDQVACVIVEPVQSRYPEHQPKEFLQALRVVTQESGAALIFDEVITGLRVGQRGAQEYFGVKADLASYGKVLGGGMPIGAVAGKHEYLDFIDGGDWHFGDDSMPLNPMTFFAGTFCKHSLAMAASYATLSKIEESGHEIFNELNQKTEQLANKLNKFFEEKMISLRIVYFSSLFRFKFSGNMDLLFYHLNLNGIYIWEGRNLFISTAHSDDDISFFINKTKEIIEELISIGYIKTNQNGVETHSNYFTQSLRAKEKRNFTKEHLRFKNMTLKSSEGALASKISVAIELKGVLDSEKLIESVRKILNRHESLKSVYDLSNDQILFNEIESLDVTHIDFSSIENSDEALNDFLDSLARNEFDLDEACMEIYLIKLSEEVSILTFMGHHIALDGLSLAMLSFDIAHMYSYLIGEKKSLKLKEVSFIDFLDTDNLPKEKAQKQLDYWVNQLGEFKKPKLFNQEGFKGERLSIDLEDELSKKLKFFGYKNKSSLMNTMMTALVNVLKVKFERDEFVVGVPIAGHVNISDSMVGNCVNLLPFIVQANSDTKEFIANLKNYQLESFKNSEISYEEVKEALEDDPIEIVLNVEPINELPEFGQLKADLMTFPSYASEYPIYINVMKIGQKINLTIDYQFCSFKNSEEANSFAENLIQALKNLVN